MIIMVASRLPVVWRKSRRSNPSGNCVELAELPDGTVAMRDSEDPHGPALLYPRETMAAFIALVRANAFGRRPNM